LLLLLLLTSTSWHMDLISRIIDNNIGDASISGLHTSM